MKQLISILCLLVTCCYCLHAGPTMVYLERCETLSFDEERHPGAQILKGNVRFRHDDALMFCDSAFFYEATNSVDAFGHVHFKQGDTLNGFGDVLYYDGNTRVARLRYNVQLIHRQTTLTTDSLNYNRGTDIAYYFTGGVIRDSLNTLESVWGQYQPSTDQAQFKSNVHLYNDQFSLSSDTLNYNTSSHIADIVGPTTIVYEGETTIHSTSGWYNTSTEKSMLLNRSLIVHTDGMSLTGDTIFYDKKIGFGQVLSHIDMTDSVEHLTLHGNYGEMWELGHRGFATDSAMLIDWAEKDTTYLHADSLFSEEVAWVDSLLLDSTLLDTAQIILNHDSVFRRVRAFHNVRLYRVDLQGVCDSLVYTGNDSVMTLMGDPVCWSDSNQISADIVYAYMKNGTIDYAHGIGSALAVKQETETFFDQMAGKEMYAYVKEGELKQVDVNGNCETVFFPRENDGTVLGCNKTESSFVKLFMQERKIHHVLFTTTTSGVMYPLDQISDDEMRLATFFWAENERPSSPESIFSHPKRTPRPRKTTPNSATNNRDKKTKK